MRADPDGDCIDPDRKRPPAILAKPGVSASDPGLKGYGTFSTLTGPGWGGHWSRGRPPGAEGGRQAAPCGAGRIIRGGGGGVKRNRRDPGKRLRTESKNGWLGRRDLDFD